MQLLLARPGLCTISISALPVTGQAINLLWPCLLMPFRPLVVIRAFLSSVVVLGNPAFISPLTSLGGVSVQISHDGNTARG